MRPKIIRATLAAFTLLVAALAGLAGLEHWLETRELAAWLDHWDDEFCTNPERGFGFGFGGGLYGTHCKYEKYTTMCVFGSRAEAEASAWRTAFYHKDLDVRVMSFEPVAKFPRNEIYGMGGRGFSIVTPTNVPETYYVIWFRRVNWTVGRRERGLQA